MINVSTEHDVCFAQCLFCVKGGLSALGAKAERKCPNKSIPLRGRQPWAMVATQPDTAGVQIATVASLSRSPHPEKCNP